MKRVTSRKFSRIQIVFTRKAKPFGPRRTPQISDALDTFGVHAVGGTLGALMTGMLARNSANANLATNLKDYVKDTLFQPLLIEQAKAVVITLLLSVIATAIIAYIVKAIIGLRPNEEVETSGLDLAEHGEEGYHGS